MQLAEIVLNIVNHLTQKEPVLYRLSPKSHSAHKDVLHLLLLIPIFALRLLLYKRTVYLILFLNLSQQEMTAHLKGCHHPLQ